MSIPEQNGRSDHSRPSMPWRLAYLLSLLLGAALGLDGLVKSMRHLGDESAHVAVRRSAVSIALLVLSAAYAFMASRKATTRRAVLALPASYAIAVMAVDSQSLLLWKEFAPEVPTVWCYVRSIAVVAGGLLGAGLLLFAAYRPTQVGTTARTVDPSP